jgi:hypothetical protein
MALNQGFLNGAESETKALARARAWLSLLPPASEVPRVEYHDEVLPRIFMADAERTFRAPSRRQEHAALLQHVTERLGGYHQGMGFVASFLRLFLDEEETIRVLEATNAHPRYIPGYWRAQAVGFATDAQVLDYAMERELPQVHAHLRQHSLLPETFAQKWFCGLCVHLLPFAALFDFFEAFLERGHVFLLAFGLAVLEDLQSELLKADVVRLYALLRLDAAALPGGPGGLEALAKRVLARAPHWEERLARLLEVESLSQLRARLFRERLQARLQAAQEHAKQEREEEEEEEEEDEEEEEEEEARPGDECQACERNVPELYCAECVRFLCGECASRGARGHQKAHRMRAVEELGDLTDLQAALARLNILPTSASPAPASTTASAPPSPALASSST